MKKCANCGTAITCGCQERTASNGVKVCASCIGQYQNMLAVQANNQANMTKSNS